MKKYVVAVSMVVALLCLTGCMNSIAYYSTVDECIEKELRDSVVELKIQGEDTSLLCFQVNDAMQFRILAERDGKWHLYLSGREKTEKIIMYDGEIFCMAYTLPDSEDKYILITEGPTNSNSVEDWMVTDNLYSTFYQIVDTRDNYDYVYYLARIPANVKSYDLQINNWIIRDMDLETVWNENESKIEVLD